MRTGISQKERKKKKKVEKMRIAEGIEKFKVLK